MVNDIMPALAWKLIWIPGVAYLVTWFAVTHYSKLAFGNVTLLWFKLLSWVVGGGVALLLCAELGHLLETYLFWRQ